MLSSAAALEPIPTLGVGPMTFYWTAPGEEADVLFNPVASKEGN